MTLGKLSAAYRETELESDDLGDLILPSSCLSVCWLCSLVLQVVEDSSHMTSHLQMPTQHNIHGTCVSFFRNLQSTSFNISIWESFLMSSTVFVFLISRMCSSVQHQYNYPEEWNHEDRPEPLGQIIHWVMS